MILHGTLRLSDAHQRRTVGKLSRLIYENAAVFERYFAATLFPGSLNVNVPHPPTLHKDLDAGRPPPAIRIPKTQLVGMPRYIGDGQAWPSRLRGKKLPYPIECWVFRRINSRVPAGVIELVAREALRVPYGLQHGDAVTIEFV